MLVTALYAAPVLACGGFFCNQQSVSQTGEQIIFAVDESTNTVQVDIQIAYQGLAPDFAWLLPLSDEPQSIETGATWAFRQIDARTAPQFRLRRENRGPCRTDPAGNQPGGRVFDAAFGVDGGTSVNVLQQSNVGPYESVVIESTDPEDVRIWLQDNGYRVTDEMMEAVTPYIAKGDVLLALKLQKNASAGAIQPISLKLPGNELCIPLRLTAIAAQDDMDVTAYVLSNSGRAIPKNYLHFTPNWTRLDWVRGAFDYRQLVGDAADEAGGNAFTTEYAGPTGNLGVRIHQEGQFALDALRRQTDLLSFLDQAQGVQLNRRSEFQGIVQSFVPNSILEEADIPASSFWRCPNCYRNEIAQVPQFNPPDFDASELVDAIDDRIVKPEIRMQAAFENNAYLTRLFTLISPDEMGLDPIFEFRSADVTGAPEVDNQHTATLITVCNADGDAVRRVLQLDDGTSVELDAMSTMPSSTLNQMPAASRLAT
jgi:hypothetical protein